MKRSLIVLTLIFLLGASSTLFADGVLAGVKGGAGAGWYSGEDWDSFLASFDADNSIKVDFSFGVFFDFPIAPFLSIQPEFLYSNYGGAYTYTYAPFGDVNGTISASGLEIPFLLKPKFRSQSGYLYLLAGPDLMLILGNVTQKEKAGSSVVKVNIEPDNNLQFGAVGGIGYAFDLPNGELSIEVRYLRAFTGIFEDDDTRFNGVNVYFGFAGGI
jgi:hypothetical protein